MRRTRKLTPGAIVHSSVDSFVSVRPRSGTHAIAIGTEWLDILYKDRGSDSTLVCFHSALTSRVQVIPAFSGLQISEDLNFNLIALADPALACGDIDLAWFLGTRGMGPLTERLPAIVRHLLGGREAILFGASGGGYAATLYGQYFADQCVVAVNPRLDLSSSPTPDMTGYLKVAHSCKSAAALARAKSKFVPKPLKDLYSDGLSFDLHILQNANDGIYRRNQFEPFARSLSNDSRFFPRLYDGAEGHSVIDGALLRAHLKQVAG